MNSRRRARKPIRRSTPLTLELLESRLAPANLDIDATGHAVLSGAANETNGFILSLDAVAHRYQFTDTQNAVTFSGAGAVTADCQQASANTVTTNDTFLVTITLDTNVMSDAVAVQSTAVPTIVTSADGIDAVTIGTSGSVQGITA